MLIGEGSAVRDIENTEQTNYKPDELLGNIVLLYVYIGVN